MNMQDTGAPRADQRADLRAHIVTLLSRYPDLTADELGEIHHWFRKGANALDIGLVASEPAIADRYRAYRAEHYDRFTPGDYLRAALFVLGALAVFGLVVAMMP